MEQSADYQYIQVNDLDTYGLNKFVIAEQYRVQSGRILTLNESLKVTPDAEGTHIKFETLDKLSVRVPALSAMGNHNKIFSNGQ